MGPHSGDDRDLGQGGGERVSWRSAEAVPEAHLDLEPVRSRWYDVAEVLAGAGCSVDDRDAGGLSRCEVDDQSGAGDPAAVAADGLQGGVLEGAGQRLAGGERTDPF
jgi:hypothetical protein